MALLIIVILGIVAGYVAIWSSVVLNKTLEERVRVLIMGVLVDVILLGFFAYIGNGVSFGWILVFKYIFLSLIDYEKTLRQ